MSKAKTNTAAKGGIGPVSDLVESASQECAKSGPPFAGQTGHAYLTRVASPRRGYLVRIPDPRPGGSHVQKFFRLRDKGTDAVLDAALAWRDTTYRALHGAPVPKRVFHARQANSSTGIPGVRKAVKTVSKKRSDGTVAKYAVPCIIAEIWLATGKDGRRSGRSRSKVYSLNKYSESDALSLAAEWRHEQERRLGQMG